MFSSEAKPVLGGMKIGHSRLRPVSSMFSKFVHAVLSKVDVDKVDNALPTTVYAMQI